MSEPFLFQSALEDAARRLSRAVKAAQQQGVEFYVQPADHPLARWFADSVGTILKLIDEHDSRPQDETIPPDLAKPIGQAGQPKPSFEEALEAELSRRYDLCEDWAATPCNILLAVTNAVAAAREASE